MLMLLAKTLVKRAGAEALKLGHKVTGYAFNANGSVDALIRLADGNVTRERGTPLIGADGIHSAVRAQMYPEQPPINWGGAIMWRGTTPGRPIRTGSSFVGLGTHRHRVVFYPISPPHPATGLATINWIAELSVGSAAEWQSRGWFRPIET